MTISKKMSAAPNLSAPEGPFYAFDRCVLSQGRHAVTLT